MIKTEAQAAACWCPFARVAFMGGTAGRVDPLTQSIVDGTSTHCEQMNEGEKQYYRDRVASTNCIASRCMAWRWFSPPNQRSDREPRGYCGAAGQPIIDS